MGYFSYIANDAPFNESGKSATIGLTAPKESSEVPNNLFVYSCEATCQSDGY